MEAFTCQACYGPYTLYLVALNAEKILAFYVLLGG